MSNQTMVLGETCETWMSGRLDVDAQSVTPLGSETLLHCAEENNDASPIFIKPVA